MVGSRGKQLAVVTCVALALPIARAYAEPSDALAKARTYFNVGARAYAAGQFDDAVQAFQQAYKLVPRVGLLFSIAQAYRKQYYLDNKPENLQAAIKYYRKYLARVPRGGRRADVAEALGELEPAAQKLQAEASPGGERPRKPATQIMVSSPTPDVSIELDGHAAGKLPFVSDVKPGKHRVVLTAPGYRDYVREISVLRGSVVPLDVPLVGKPAWLTVRAPAGARVSVDGRQLGSTPLAPVELAAGRHFILVAKNGHEAFSREQSFGRGQTVQVDANLSSTTQRTVSWVLMGAGVSAVVAGGILGFEALRKQSDAQSILDRRTTHNISANDLGAYTQLRNERDQFRSVGLIAAGAGVAVAATGVVLFVFDEPHAATPARPELGPRPTHTPEEPSMEISAVPLWSPGAAGAELTGRF